MKSIYDNGKTYALFHWFVHLLFAHLLLFLSGVSLIGGYLLSFKLLGTAVSFPLLDYLMIYCITAIIDLDHAGVLRKYGLRGLFKFARRRVQYPLHNFFLLGVFSLVSAMFAIADISSLAILLLAPALHMVWDIVEDVFIFRLSYRKWERTWGIGAKELEIMWREMKLNRVGREV